MSNAQKNTNNKKRLRRAQIRFRRRLDHDVDPFLGDLARRASPPVQAHQLATFTGIAVSQKNPTKSRHAARASVIPTKFPESVWRCSPDRCRAASHTRFLRNSLATY